MGVTRTSQLEAVVLRVVPYGQTAGLVTLLTDSAGMIPAIAYGLNGKKSSLRGKVVQFARGTAFTYRNPRSDTGKLTDFAVARYVSHAHTDLGVYFHASLLAEAVWRTYGGGQHDAAVFVLVDQALSAIDRPDVEPSHLRRVSTITLWRYLRLLGLQPDIGRGPLPAAGPLAGGGAVVYNHGHGAGPSTEEAGARYLLETDALALPDAFRVAVDPSALRAAWVLVVGLVQHALSGPLHTLRVAGAAL